MNSQDIFQLLNLGLSVVKDLSLAQCLKRVETAQRNYLEAEAEANRTKSRSVIMSIARLDREIISLEVTYLPLKDTMGEKGREVMDLLVSELEKERKRLVKKKKQINQ